MDRRFIYAIILMMVIAIVPSFLIKPSSRPAATGNTALPADSIPAPAVPQAQIGAPTGPLPRDAVADDDTLSGVDTVLATTELYRYGVSTLGGRLVDVTLLEYESMAAGEKDEPVQLMLRRSNLLGLKLQVGNDTLDLTDWHFTTSTLDPAPGEPVVLQASRGGVVVTLRYTFAPDDYRIMVEGEISGIGPNGGTLLIGMGPGFRNTEADSTDNYHQLAIVTAQNGTSSHPVRKLDPGQLTTFPGPFDWVAFKSK
ncbi:MAG: membrane protein insertase YidC [Gemmatimonadales bacterium]